MALILWLALLLADQPPTPKPGSEVSRDIVTSPARRVTASYIRMHAPGVVLSMAQDVKAGKLDRRLLDAVAGPKAAKALVAAKIGGASRKRAAVAVKPGTKTLRPLGVPAGHSFGTFTDDDGVLIDLTADYAPSELAFPNLYEGERSDSLFLLHPTTDGAVTASLPEDHNFKIVDIRTYDGLISLEPAQIRPVVSVSQKRTSPPWTLSAAAGQTVGVLVRFEPKFHFVENGAGQKSSTLEVSLAAPAWKVAVPLRGRFRGRSLGVIAYADQPEITVVMPDSYFPKQPHRIVAPVELVNTTEAAQGTIRALSVPPGVSMGRLPVSIGTKETKVVEVPLEIDRSDTTGIWWGSYEYPHPVILEVQFGDRTSQVGFYIVMYQGILKWSFHHENLAFVDVSGNLIVFGSGNFRFFAQASHNDLVVHRVVTFRGGFDGLDLINMVITAFGGPGNPNSYGFHRQYYEDNFTGLVHKGLTLKIKVRYPS